MQPDYLVPDREEREFKPRVGIYRSRPKISLVRSPIPRCGIGNRYFDISVDIE